MAAEALEDTPSQILAPGLGHLPEHLPRRLGPTVGHMPGAGPMGGQGWAQARCPQACGVDSSSMNCARSTPEDYTPSGISLDSEEAADGLGQALKLGTFCLNSFSSASGLLSGGISSRAETCL